MAIRTGPPIPLEKQGIHFTERRRKIQTVSRWQTSRPTIFFFFHQHFSSLAKLAQDIQKEYSSLSLSFSLPVTFSHQKSLALSLHYRSFSFVSLRILLSRSDSTFPILRAGNLSTRVYPVIAPRHL